MSKNMAYDDLQALCPQIERCATEALGELGGRLGHYYGPRLLLAYRRKKRIERLLFEIKNEASLIRRTAISW